ncbi:Rieske (2Fe-2S) protein [Streptomyces sp. NPDC059248]|uniref:Rieske (2Fe-2S) protein n=1 Tax=Streptomyces sp. NPDC059248 TaxID=3346791 RepID=UPI0036A79608
MDATRRTVLAAGAAGAAALATGCTDGDGDGGGGTAEHPATPEPSTQADAASPGAPATGASPSASMGRELAKRSAVPVGGGTVFKPEKVVVVQPTAGQFKAYSAVCPHQGCLVDKVADGTIDCPCHDSRFRIADGSVAKGPATRPLPPAPITVTADAVLLP